MALSKRTFETIIDLIENKMSCMEGWDQATSRERAKLEACRRELMDLYKPSAEPVSAELEPLQHDLSHQF
ncbi:MAG: hypothetical protein OEM59_19500 [Rhodospirillales bacterium]|nr:hypothetical protein [Rhodospirillales bacterium]